MTTHKVILVMFRLSIMYFILPLTLLSIIFSRIFEKALRDSLERKPLNEVQRVLNWKGITGIFELARRPK